MKRLSIIIVTYNSEGDIYECIASIREHADIPWNELEIIVVDNNSKDADSMFARIRELYGEDIILIKNVCNGGYGQGNNVGIRRATSPLILIMNPDVRMMEPILKQTVEEFEKDAGLAMYGMKQMISATECSPFSFCCAYSLNGYLYTILSSICNRFNWYIAKYMHFSGACFFIRKDMFVSAGLFDETIFMYGEEEDIHFRMWQHGYRKLVYNPNMHYIHLIEKRAPSLKYEIKLLDVAIILGKKKGISAYRMLKNRLENNTMLIWRERVKGVLGKRNDERISVLLELRKEIKRKMAQTSPASNCH